MLVTEIGKEAFKQCVKLSSVAIPSGVTRIGDWAFNGCGGLTRVTMPDSVTAIGSGAFFGCTKLTGVTLPDSVTSIGDNAFFGCNSLTALAIPDSVTSIGFAAFWHCNGLTNVTLQDCVAEIGGWLFMGCGGLESICVDASNPAYASTADGILFNRDRTCIRLYPTGRAGSYVIPRTVTNVWDWAFGGCTKLSGVTIPSSVKVIRPWAFQECTGLTNVTIPNSVTFIEGNPFRNCSGLTRIDVEETNPVYSNDDDGVLFDKKRSWLLSYPAGKAGSYTLADGVIGIAHSAFQWCRYLTSVTVPESVTSVHSEAFRNCENLTAVYFEGDAPRLGRDVFEESPKARIYYQAGRKGWGGEFGGRPTSLSGNPPATLSGGAETPARSGGPVRVLPARRYYPPRTASDGDAAATQGVATAPRLPFAYTTDDGSITITKYTGPGGEVTIPRTINGLPVTSIGQRAFQRCADITSVTISSGLTTIGECAFEFCGGLTAITIPASVTSMGGNPFASGSSLTSIVVDAANPAYCSDADGVMYSKDRTSLLSCPAGKAGSYVVPDGVNSIGWLAFGGCSKLSSVTIPTSVTDIGWAAFGSCTGLTDLAIPSSVTNIGPAAVGGCNVWVDPANPAYSSCADGVVFNKDKTKLVRYPPRKAGGYVIPEGVITIADGAFNGCSMLTDVTFPESVTSIGASAFWNCSGLASLTIPDGVTSIGDSAFTSCYGLTDVALPGSVTSIGPYAFCDCPRLTSANFQGDAPGLGRGAFLDSNRATIYYQPGTKGWGPDFGGRPTAIWDPGKVRAPIPLPSKRLLDRGAVGESTPE
ncbi:MAG: leucine-rich repeat domain-containing protein [Verrucomicrobiae bacterium]|nr:leucine-rich repeat domain-containing protein [Verrucomicrobiae bacterium]